MRRYLFLSVVVVLIVGVCVGAWQGLIIRRHRREAELCRQRDAQWMTTYQRAKLAFASADYPEVEKVLLTILPEAEQSYPHDRRLADALGMLGKCYRADHNYQQAEPILNRALQLYETIPLGDTSEMGRMKLNLANIYRDEAKYDEAERSYSEALAIFEKNSSPTGFDRGGALLNLGAIRVKQGRYSEAEDFLNRSITAYGSAFGTFVQEDLASAEFQLAGAYDFERRYPEAKEHYLKALVNQEKVSGPSSPQVGQLLARLAQVYMSLGETSKANKVLNRAQKTAQQQTATGGHPSGLVFEELGAAAERAGKYADAETLYKKSIHALETTAGPDAGDLAEPLEDLGRLYRGEQQFDVHKAEPLLKRALSIREKTLGKEDPKTADVLSDLSLLYFYEHRFKEADDFAERALPIQEKAYGPESLEVSTTLNRLGIAERDEGKLMQAESVLKRALAIREKGLPPSHSWIAISLENLASVYALQNQMDKATPLLIRAQAIRVHPAGG